MEIYLAYVAVQNRKTENGVSTSRIKRCKLVNKKDVKVKVTCGSGLNDAIPPPPDKYANKMSPG
jgi:hypothetical protein